MGNLKRFGVPKTDYERLVSHFGIQQAHNLLKTYGREAYNFLPERGQRFTTAGFEPMGLPNQLDYKTDGRDYTQIEQLSNEDQSRLNRWLNMNREGIKVVFKNKPPKLGLFVAPFGKIVGLEKLYTSRTGTFWIAWVAKPGFDTKVVYVVLRQSHPQYAYLVGKNVDVSVDGFKEWLEGNLPQVQELLARIQNALASGEEPNLPEPEPEPKGFMDYLLEYWYIPIGLGGLVVLLLAMTGGKKSTPQPQYIPIVMPQIPAPKRK